MTWKHGRIGAYYALIIWLSTLIGGCTSLPGSARLVQPPIAAGIAFPGLLPSDADRVARRYIFQIHGIDTVDPDWGEPLLKAITRYGYDRVQEPGPIDAYWHPATLSKVKIISGSGLNCKKIDDCTFTKFGQYKIDLFENRKTGDQIKVFTYFWRRELWRITGLYLESDIRENNASFPSTQKSIFNQWIKSGLVDNGLSDAAGYLSPIGELEREGLETALCAMVADAASNPEALRVAPGKGCLGRLAPLSNFRPGAVEFNFLSHSLGSRMLYDVLSQQEPELGVVDSVSAMDARIKVANQTRTFFMAANQLPLLAVSEIKVSTQAADGPRAALSEQSQQAIGFLGLHHSKPHVVTADGNFATAELSVVAFQDPDDLLGFKASDAVLGSLPPSVRISDVLHRNTSQWLFLLAWPTSAHDRELDEPNSLRMILCGATTNRAGVLKANRCLDGL